METELKLIVPEQAIDAVEHWLESEWQGTVSRQQTYLTNDYYDTAKRDFNAHRIGFRVRGKDGHYEQTVKLAGSAIGGLHRRPEFNLPLPDANPNLNQFDADIWPRGLDPAAAQQELEKVFSTNFTRHIYLLQADDMEVELVLDKGEVIASSATQPICEVELELHRGEPTLLVDIAEQLLKRIPFTLSNESKASRGYQLASGNLIDQRLLPPAVPVDVKDSTEQAFLKALQIGLEHWQHHENQYLQTGKPKAIIEMTRGIKVLLNAVSLYLPVLQCDPLLAVHRQLMSYYGRWHWHQELQNLMYLRAKKGLLSKRLQADKALMSYIRGRIEGLLQQHAPQDMIRSRENVALQLALTRLMLSLPWRGSSHGWDQRVDEHVRGWLSQGLQTILQSMPDGRLSMTHYLTLENILRQVVSCGYLVTVGFGEDRDRFRAPWLDLLEGVDELKALALLENIINDADIENRDELRKWGTDKMNALIDVMEQTRRVALQAEAYW